MENSPWIVEATDETFVRDVIERSKETPVVVDFWAEWCGPCRMLGPVLEKLATQANGRFVLVKANTDKTQQVAGQFGVQSIPAVFAVRNGQIVDQFVGVLPERDLLRWLDSWLPGPGDVLTSEADALAASDPAGAEDKYRRAMELAPQNSAPRIGLARLLLEQGRTDDSRKVIDELADRGFLEPEAEAIDAKLKLQKTAASAGDLDQARAAAAAAPKDWNVQWNLAQSLAAAGKTEEALDTCLRLVQFDKQRTGQQAKALMLDLFHILGAESELASTYRRKLSTALY